MCQSVKYFQKNTKEIRGVMMSSMVKYVPTIGIETHVQLKTKTKLFAAVDNDARNAEPNTKVSPICFGLPGTLPYLNEQAVELGIKAGLALGVEPQPYSIFERKHYFYPDLPLGYQITQLEHPLIKGGFVAINVNNTSKKIRIHRVQLEADAGKSIHPASGDYSLVDLNRAGTPLLEIVSEPDLHTAAEAKAYVRELYLLMKYAGVSDVDLYHGNMRFDVNVSLAEVGSQTLGTRTETKNLNSFRSVEKAVEFEINRQTKLLEKGEIIMQETRGWDESKQKTLSQRGKEEAHDYRYFPEPDIPPVEISKEQIAKAKKEMPVLPNQIRSELSAVGVEKSHIETLLGYPQLISTVHQLSSFNRAIGKFGANLLVNVWLAETESNAEDLIVNVEQLKRLHVLVENGTLNSTSVKKLFLALQKANSNKNVEDLAKEMSLIQVSDRDELESLVKKVITEYPQAAEDVKKGEMKAIGFLVGQVMKSSKGQANPQLVQEILRKKLK
jgi:aspartyl-tRNA(Asn)/glutamyl-tRNA(Gln) amidotransferase subunit B